MTTVNSSFELHKRISALNEHQRANYLAGLKAAGLDSPVLRIAPRTTDEELAPVSLQQRGMWFLHQLNPENPYYNLPLLAFRVSGTLDPSALQRSIDELTRRHESLRTIFRELDGEPYQVISTDTTLPIRTVDLRGVPQCEREHQARQIASAETVRPYDLARGPLWRVTLVCLDDEHHQILISMHHIISDAWSLGILYRELSALYSSYANGQPSPLAKLPIQFADYALWQRQWMQSGGLDEQREYWLERLAGIPELIQLPADYRRPDAPSYCGARETLLIPEDFQLALRNFCDDQQISNFMLLMAALKLLLFRYTGQSDVLVGSPFAGRNQIDTERLIGFFVNVVVLRTDLSGNPTVRELLQRVRETQLAMYEYNELPFDMLVEGLRPTRNLSYNPIFQVAFGLHNAPSANLELAGSTVEQLQLPRVSAPFEFGLFVRTAERYVRKLEFEYSCDLFDASTIRRMLDHFKMLLEGIVSQPDQPIAELPLMDSDERQQVLVRYNTSESQYPKNVAVHQLFERQAEQALDSVGVQYDDHQLTYGKLNARANQLAHYLRRLGVAHETRVGICMERGIDMVVGLLSILKAGGAYVPLDPEYAAQRLAFMLEDAQCPVLLVNGGVVNDLPECSAHVVCLDRHSDNISLESDENPAGFTAADQAAYVMYTSGSTGKPKGVTVPHRAIIQLIRDTNYIRLAPHDVIAQSSNCSFDASSFEIWGALLSGARLFGYRKETVLALHGFASQLTKHQITTLFLPTALFNQFAREFPSTFQTLGHLLFGGETADPHCVDEVVQCGRPARLLHVYGPTETTTFASWFLVNDVPQRANTIPIGKPLTNTQLYILDDEMHPVPVGVPGELYIGGDGLALSYLNRPANTSERFVPHPFCKRYQPRLYKTGDQCRWLSGGNVEFLGRLDDQVKTRGFRVELGEIVSTLRQHHNVDEAVVSMRDDKADDKRLVAHVVATAGTALVPHELRRFMKERLPSYMVPSAFVFMKALPLTANGKVDRCALPNPQVRSSSNQPFVRPSTVDQRKIAAIWTNVLDVDPVGIDDNFFDMGGSSLRLPAVLNRLQKAFDREVTIVDLFEHTTVRGLAEFFAERTPTSDSASHGRRRGQHRRATAASRSLRAEKPK